MKKKTIGDFELKGDDINKPLQKKLQTTSRSNKPNQAEGDEDYLYKRAGEKTQVRVIRGRSDNETQVGIFKQQTGSERRNMK